MHKSKMLKVSTVTVYLYSNITVFIFVSNSHLGENINLLTLLEDSGRKPRTHFCISFKE